MKVCVVTNRHGVVGVYTDKEKALRVVESGDMDERMEGYMVGSYYMTEKELK